MATPGLSKAQVGRAVTWGGWLLVLLPAIGFAANAARGGLSPNPVEDMTHVSGEWALRWLLASLAVTPLRRLSGASWLAPLRRTFGLAACGYATAHFGVYLVFDHFFDWRSITEDVLERRYVTAGFASFVAMLPLAATSTRASIRRLGRRWITLHRLAYVAGIAAALHFVWLAKADLLAPLIHAGILAVLLGARALRLRRPGAATA